MNNKPINLSININNVSNNAIINTNQNVEQEIGTRRPMELLFSQNTNQVTLVSREISDDKKRQYNEVMSIYIDKLIELTVEFVIKELNQNYEFPRTEKTSSLKLLENLAKLIESITILQDEIARKFRFAAKVEANKILDDLFLSLESTYSRELMRNVTYSGSIYREFCMKYFEFNEERKRVALLSFDNDKRKRIVPKLERQIKDALVILKSFMEQKYYYWLRNLLNPHKSIYEKGRQFFEYIGEKVNAKADENIYQIMVLDIYFSPISNIACYASRLQNFIVILSRAERSTKTLEDLKILANECKLCYDYYHEDIENYNIWQRSKSEEIAYIEDYLKIKNYLNNLCKVFDKMVDVESKKPYYNKPIKANKSSNQKKESSTQEISQGNKAEIQNNLEKKNIINEKSVTDNIINEEIDLEEIQEEVSDLMESIMRMIDCDRKKKMELKEAKALAALSAKNNLKKENNNQENNSNIEVNKTENQQIIKLNNKRKDTLELIFGKENTDREISKDEVEFLIESLGGYIQGKGDGNRFKIYWGEKGHKCKSAGYFEVIHGNDGKDLLKGGWVDRVKAAIEAGVNSGYISSKTLEENLDK
ncbi:MAG: hypothetical protein C5B43_04855 [Verrucomicrobia bacterium]|nr:MAG: hypothetical protein C5B43_04855 [Verrucomicrobiota bacterium]